MGRLIRRYIRAYKLTVRGGGIVLDATTTTGITLSGTITTGISVSNTVAKYAAISTKVTGADGEGSTYGASFKIAHTNTVAITSNRLCAMSINCEPADSLDALKIVGAEVCTYLPSATEVSTTVHGLFVETQGGGTLGGDYYSLYVYSAPGANPTGDSACIRVESNPSTITWVDSFINLVGNPNYTFAISCQGTANSSSGVPTTIAGWMKVNAGGSDRWIALYSTSP